jgi:hypothetical protein
VRFLDYLAVLALCLSGGAVGGLVAGGVHVGPLGVLLLVAIGPTVTSFAYRWAAQDGAR